MSRKKAIGELDMTNRLHRFRARQRGHDVPKLPAAGYGKKRGRKDANHLDIVVGLRKHGIIVFDMPSPGDILCFRPPHVSVSDGTFGCKRIYGCWTPMEIKTDGGELTDSQRLQLGLGGQIPIVRNLTDALGLFGILEASS